MKFVPRKQVLLVVALLLFTCPGRTAAQDHVSDKDPLSNQDHLTNPDSVSTREHDSNQGPLTTQEPLRRNALHLSAGVSVPYDEFAASTFTYRAGFAQAGVNLHGGIIHYGRRKIFGVYADAGYAYLFFNEKHYLSEYERIFEDVGTMRVTTEGYHFIRAEVGLLLRTIAILDTRIIFQSGVGYTLFRHPYLSAINTYWGIVNTVNSDYDIQLSGSAGIRLEHAIDEYTGIYLSYQLFASRPDFTDTESYRDHHFYMPVRTQHINFGITRYF